MSTSRCKPDVTMDEKNMIAQFLIQNQQKDGKIRPRAQLEAAAQFGFSSKTIQNIWREAKKQQALGIPVHLQSKRRGGNHKDKKVLDVEKMKALSMLERSSIRKLAAKLNVSKSLVGVWIKQKIIRPHSSAIKPILSDIHKLARLRFALSQLSFDNQQGPTIKYQSMNNTIHIDEKWFYMTKTTDRYYLLPAEKEPYRTCQSKRYIPKIMFMCVVGRPQFAEDGSVLFDGKFGIFPFITTEPAKRNSKNRGKGTMQSKAIESVTLGVTKEMLINQILPVVKAKWPATSSKNIIIQQDNARPHIHPQDPDFNIAANTDGFNIKLICQPANSPDSNVNDLGFFRAIQSLQDDFPAKTVDDLLKNVYRAFEEQTPHKLNHVWLTLQGCYTEMMKVRGGNNYKVPHMNKARLERLGLLPTCLEVEEGLVRDCIDYLMLPENQAGYNYDLGPLMTHFGM